MIDPAMPFLDRALDLMQAQAAFARANSSEGEIAIRSIHLLRHKPGRRAVIEYCLQANDGGLRTLVGKARAKGLDQKSCDITNKLSAEFDNVAQTVIRIPRPVAVVPEFNMWLQEKVLGELATKILITDAGLRLAPRLAEAAHRIHSSAVVPSRTHTVSDELRILTERLEAVAAANAVLRTRLENMLCHCHALADSVADAKLLPIHRDFHPGQVLVDGSRLWLLDFDLFSLGDPAVDVGNFIAHMTELSLRHFGNEHQLLPVERAIEDAYVALTSEEIRARIRIYALLTLARHIYISTQFDERRPFTEAILAVCERRLAQRF